MKKQYITYFCQYILVYTVWSIWQRIAVPFFVQHNGNVIWVDVITKCMIWIVPFLGLLKKRDEWFVNPKEMLCSAFPFVPCVGMLSITTCFLYTVKLVVGLQSTYTFWDWNYLLLAVSTGLVEEIAFRGFLFNRLASKMGLCGAAGMSSMVFAFYHYPNIVFGTGLLELLSFRFAMLFIVGVFFALFFYKWKNLWLTVIVHAFWNLLSYIWAMAG